MGNSVTNKILGSVGLAKRRDTLTEIVLPAAALITAGAVVGAAAALLLTPRPGPAIRRELTAGVKDLTQKVSNGISRNTTTSRLEENASHA
jgi:hypothetical protein